MLTLLYLTALIGAVLGCGEDIGRTKWVDSSNNIALDRNFPYVKNAKGTNFFICKGLVDETVYGGIYIEGEPKYCRVIVGDIVKKIEEFFVLVCAPSSMWVPVDGKLLPINALKAGGDVMCRGVLRNNQATIGTLGKTSRCDEETSLCTEYFICRGTAYSKADDFCKIELIDNFSILTFTNGNVITEGEETSISFDLTVRKTSNLMSFNVKGSEDLLMRFLNKSNQLVFEFLIGGLHNSITAIRTWKTTPKYVNSSYTPYVLDEYNYSGFYISWDMNKIMIGYTIKYPRIIRPAIPLVSFSNAEVYNVTCFTLSSNKKAHWNIFVL